MAVAGQEGIRQHFGSALAAPVRRLVSHRSHHSEVDRRAETFWAALHGEVKEGESPEDLDALAANLLNGLTSSDATALSAAFLVLRSLASLRSDTPPVSRDAFEAQKNKFLAQAAAYRRETEAVGTADSDGE